MSMRFRRQIHQQRRQAGILAACLKNMRPVAFRRVVWPHGRPGCMSNTNDCPHAARGSAWQAFTGFWTMESKQIVALR